PTTAMPKKGGWEKRLEFVAKKADEYPLLDSNEDIVYFRAVANALINSKKKGVLREFTEAYEDDSLVKSAINSVVYLLDRSEKSMQGSV
ncbi:hypothetical protein ACFL6I_21180, partial [candidate division KSB1 bacterium]